MIQFVRILTVGIMGILFHKHAKIMRISGVNMEKQGQVKNGLWVHGLNIQKTTVVFVARANTKVT